MVQDIPLLVTAWENVEQAGYVKEFTQTSEAWQEVITHLKEKKSILVNIKRMRKSNTLIEKLKRQYYPFFIHNSATNERRNMKF